MTQKKSNKAKPVESLKHKDKRANIPTEELRDFVKEDETRPKTMLYPRDPSLDPQLVWKGKDEQDQQDLAVPALPIYIQEKIHPQAIIEDIRRTVQKEAPAQFNLFADFNGLEFEEMIEFYQHEANWTNRMILGDSLYVMTSLAEKEGLKGQVQMIYIDPPYGIKFGSNWQVSTRKRDVKDGRAEDVTRQPEQIRAFRDTWKLGIHSYLSYLRDRLVVARELLTETGSVFVQIGDDNVHLVRCLLDEVFGSENTIVTICFKKKAYQEAAALAPVNDYILWYAKLREMIKYRPILIPIQFEGNVGKYRRLVSPVGEVQSSLGLDESTIQNKLQEGWRLMRDDYPIVSQDPPPKPQPFAFHGFVYEPTPGRHWSVQYPEGMKRLAAADRLRGTEKRLYSVVYWDDSPSIPLSNFWGALKGPADPIYVVQTTSEVVERCLLMTTDPGDLVLDPTCGSGTTAYVAEQWGRRWITIDTSRVALALARTRIMAAKYPYYLLADSPEGIKKEAEITGKTPPEYKTQNDIKKGFVYKRVPHITLKSIANNPEIDTIHSKWQKKMEPIRAKLNSVLKTSWEEWEIPRDPEDKWPREAKKLHKEWWDHRRKRQEEIDRSIARNADQEILYDQPYEDRKRIRVSGPFTVESLSPHRVLSTEEEMPVSEKEGRKSPGSGQFETMILENLKKAGVQNTIKNERLYFDRLEPYAGTWIQA